MLGFCLNRSCLRFTAREYNSILILEVDCLERRWGGGGEMEGEAGRPAGTMHDFSSYAEGRIWRVKREEEFLRMFSRTRASMWVLSSRCVWFEYASKKYSISTIKTTKLHLANTFWRVVYVAWFILWGICASASNLGVRLRFGCLYYRPHKFYSTLTPNISKKFKQASKRVILLQIFHLQRSSICKKKQNKKEQEKLVICKKDKFCSPSCPSPTDAVISANARCFLWHHHCTHLACIEHLSCFYYLANCAIL